MSDYIYLYLLLYKHCSSTFINVLIHCQGQGLYKKLFYCMFIELSYFIHAHALYFFLFSLKKIDNACNGCNVTAMHNWDAGSHIGDVAELSYIALNEEKV